MGSSNLSLIQKADLALADLTSGGLLVAEQSKTFMEILIKESTLLPQVTTVPMRNPTYEVPKVGFTGQILHPAAENTALAVADRAVPTLGKTTLTAQEVIGEVRIPYSVLEDNIEHENFNGLILGLLAKGCSRDVEMLVIQGDTTSTNPLLAMFNGALAQATTYVVAAGNVRLTKEVLRKMVQSLPAEFVTPKHKFLTSLVAQSDYGDSIANRQTAGGDASLVEGQVPRYRGRDVEMVPLFPENLTATTTNVLLCDPKNLFVGIHRDIKIEQAKDISARQMIIVVTMRLHAQWAHEPAVVKATQILASAH